MSLLIGMREFTTNKDMPPPTDDNATGDNATNDDASSQPNAKDASSASPSSPENAKNSSPDNKPSPTATIPADQDTDTGAPSMPKTKHRGNQGNFHGDQLETLEDGLGEYVKLTDPVVKSKWLAAFLAEWAETYPWHRGEEPEKYAVLGDEKAEITEEERAALVAERDAELEQVKIDGQKVSL